VKVRSERSAPPTASAPSPLKLERAPQLRGHRRRQRATPTLGPFKHWRVVKVALGSGSAAPTRAGAITLQSGESNLSSAVIDAVNGVAYFGTNTTLGSPCGSAFRRRASSSHETDDAGAGWVTALSFYSHAAAGGVPPRPV